MRILIANILLFCFTGSYSQKLVTVKVGDDISLKIPADFVNMSEIVSKTVLFATSRIPLAQYTSEYRDVDLGINNNMMQWTKKDTKTIYGFYKSSIQSLFDKIEFIKITGGVKIET